MIEVRQIRKEFRLRKRYPGFLGSIRSLFTSQSRTITAVDDISFHIEPGELVAYVGQNGAGKSTTIKMMTGILTPSAGDIRVNGLVPYENRKANARNIGVVFGQRTQLWWDLPLRESYDLLRAIYRLPYKQYKTNLDFFTELLDLGEFLDQPVRKLSLGQRMRADLAASLLHDPPILLLDEPSIGLDVLAKEKTRRFIREVNREKNTTILLTTHDVEEIESLCRRIIVIDHGKKLYDGTLQEFRDLYQGEMEIVVRLRPAGNNSNWPPILKDLPDVQLEADSAEVVTLRFPGGTHQLGEIFTALNGAGFEVRDIIRSTNNFEKTLKQIYRGSLRLNDDREVPAP